MCQGHTDADVVAHTMQMLFPLRRIFGNLLLPSAGSLVIESDWWL
jgi:hypothetical protein